MKTLAFILSLFFLVNCFSYKTVGTSNTLSPEPSKTYSIQLKSGESIIAKNVRNDGDNYRYVAKNDQEKIISKDDVNSFSEKEFSSRKTIGTVLGIAAIAGGLLFLASTLMF